MKVDDETGRSPRNRTLRLDQADIARLEPLILEAASLHDGAPLEAIVDRVILGDTFALASRLPPAAFDLLVADPPYNMDKDFGAVRGRAIPDETYEAWTGRWLDALLPSLKKGASIYVCGDWRSSSAVYRALAARVEVRNRIVWEREKGRAAAANWKNAHEDIWYAVVPGAEPHFDLNAVRQRRRVVAPYRDGDGNPKDWIEDAAGRWRDTAASNLWTDLSVPFWSMSENTEHPTQKPEKLLAKLVLASSRQGDLVLDPFLGSGSTGAVCRKLGRSFTGIEIDRDWCLVALKRLELSSAEPRIQGYADGLFWERNELVRRGLTRSGLKP